MKLDGPLGTFLAEAQRVPWAMEPRHFDALVARMQGLSVEASIEQPLSVDERRRRSRELRADSMSIDERAGMAVIPIKGVLLQSVPLWVRYYGIEATGYDELLDDISAAMANAKVRTVKLLVESPGGHAIGAADVADAMHALALEKTVTAETRGIMASAAYFIASQADSIAAGPDAIVGSIGAFTSMVDISRLAANFGVEVHRIASGPFKGAGMMGTKVTPEQIAEVQRTIDSLAENFKSAVARGRKESPQTVEEWATGEVWVGEAALAAGLVDEIERMNESMETSPGGPAAADLTRKGEQMTEQEKAAAAEKAKQEAIAAERQRCAAIKGAFPRDPAFALAQIESGASLAEAKAAYSEVVEARNAELEAENTRLKAAPPPAQARPASQRGVPAVQSEPQAEEPIAAGADFITEARRIKAERKLASIGDAMSALAKEKPELHSAFLAHMRQRAPAVALRKKDLAIR